MFIFKLPIKSMSSQRVDKAVENASVLAITPLAVNILLVEDHPLVREIVLMILSRRSWQTTIAETGRDAIRKWQEGAFDVILMDLHMPDMNGLEATREIRRQESDLGKSVGIVGLTAEANGVVLKECLKAGMNEVIVKPFEAAHLYASIERCLAG